MRQSVVTLVLILATVAANAQTAKHAAASASAPLRTPDGHPDLQGIWNNGTVTPLERPDEFKGKASFSLEEAQAYEQTWWDRTRQARGSQYQQLQADANTIWNEPMPLDRRRTSMIVDPPDGRLPTLVAAAMERAIARAKKSFDDPEGSDLQDRCLLASRGNTSSLGPPIVPNPVVAPYYQIVQTDDYVMINTEWYHDTRVIRLNGTHAPPAIQAWLGDSVGHWEDGTLVIDTTNFRPDTQNLNSSSKLHVIERLSKLDSDTLVYRATVDDSDTWTAPWTLEFTFRATKNQMFEFACHEGNYSLKNSLLGARAVDRKKAADLQ
jgi:hypothetical protein